MRPYRRKKKLIRPALQFRITLAIMSTTILILSGMGVLVSWFLSGDSIYVPAGSEGVVSQLMSVLSVAFAMTLLFLIPVTLYVGIKVTHLTAGPLYRMEQFLKAVIQGEQVDDCRIRRGDELQDFCALLNRATKSLREEAGRKQSEASEECEPAEPAEPAEAA